MNQTIGIGILGAGFISNYHVLGLQAAGADVLSICGRNEEKTRAKAAELKIPEYTTEVEKILSRQDIQAVVIATPDPTHEKLVYQAIEAKKAILVQKPMAPTSAACLRMIQAAKKANIPLYTSWMHRYFPEIGKIKEILEKGGLGSIFSIRQRNATAGADWASWFFQKDQVGGGVVLQLGTHGIDLIRYLFGEIKEVQAVTTRMKKERILQDGSTVVPDNEDTALVLYRLESGVVVTHEIADTEVAGTDRFRMEIYGEKGTAWLRTERGDLSIYAPEYLQEEGWFTPTLPASPPGKNHHQHFLSMLQKESPPDASAHDGYVAILVAEAIYRSSESGIWETVFHS